MAYKLIEGFNNTIIMEIKSFRLFIKRMQVWLRSWVQIPHLKKKINKRYNNILYTKLLMKMLKIFVRSCWQLCQQLLLNRITPLKIQKTSEGVTRIHSLSRSNNISSLDEKELSKYSTNLAIKYAADLNGTEFLCEMLSEKKLFQLLNKNFK